MANVINSSQRNQQQAQQRQQPQRTQQQQYVERSAWQQHRSQNWQSDHRNWQQRGGYRGYRIPEEPLPRILWAQPRDPHHTAFPSWLWADTRASSTRAIGSARSIPGRRLGR